MIYLDNSSTTHFKPLEVIQAAVNAIRYLSVNPGRASHSEAIKGARLMFSAREHIADLFGFKYPERVILTSGCTAALNQAIFGLRLHKKHVITTVYEHNAVLRSLFELKRRGEIALTVVNPDENGIITARVIAKALRQDTGLVAVNHISNVTGAVARISEIGALCRSNNVLFLVDAAQSAGISQIDMSEDMIDMLALPAHKGLHGLPGVGALLVSKGVPLYPVKFGGTGTASDNVYQGNDFPEDFEAGTVNLPGIAAFLRAARLAKTEMKARQKTICDLSRRAIAQLKALNGVTIYTPQSSFGGIICFNVENMSCHQVANILSEHYNICVRSGLHCAPLVAGYIGAKSGTVRASLSFDNTAPEIDFFVRAIAEISHSI